ncbi:DUF2125 domain-containing protein [Pseudogemmobacter bohemicus]|uniref:DUF2125 domain-containing protein n=1 Tax=Pseudogemmobacter bohemicus TaxID=2250708 RepID=UPI000DD30CAD|nr:DUF2125 domain-containing protein [Pseudogemmobacter bohemicus]
MKRWTISAATVLAIVIPLQAAQAVTPEEVWNNWKLSIGSDATLTTRSETRNGAALEIRGIEITSTGGEAGATLKGQFESVILTDRGDGSVLVQFPKVLRYEYNEARAQPGKPNAVIEMSQSPGGEVIASGTAEAVRYDFSQPEVSVKLVEAHDNQGTVQDIQLSASLARISGHYLLTQVPGADYKIDMKSEIGPVALTISGTRPEDKSTYSVTMTIDGAKSAMAGTFLPPEAMANLSAAIAAGAEFDMSLTTGALVLDVDAVEAGSPVKLSARLDSSDMGFLMNRANLGYGMTMMGGNVLFEAPGKDMQDGRVAFAEVTQRILMPAGPSVEAADFSYLMRLTDVTLSEALWTIFDPGAVLTREPASMIVDLTGKGAWLYDVFNTATDEPMAGGEMPLRLDSLALRQVLVKFAGAGVDASGALTFDNTDRETFQGFPAPEGKITVNLSGVSALLDKLVALGVVSANDLTGIRMGMAMFTRPGAGPDQLTTGIEFRNKGLFVNGQQLM